MKSITPPSLRAFILWLCVGLWSFISPSLSAQNPITGDQSMARYWTEIMLQSIREDFARPPVQARNLFHFSAVMYDAWAAYDSVARPYMLGNRIGNYYVPFEGVPKPANVQAAREEAMSYAVFRLLSFRFRNSPNRTVTLTRLNNTMANLKYDIAYTGVDYKSGKPADLGNYIGQQMIQMGLQDGSNEINNYVVRFYKPVNPPMQPEFPGVSGLRDPNRWQPLALEGAIDQNGNPIPALQVFQSPEWGYTQPFALPVAERKELKRDEFVFPIYYDPGPFPTIQEDGKGLSDEYKWQFSLVLAWSSHLDPRDGVVWDISPASIGNTDAATYPKTWAEYHSFYDFAKGGTIGSGRPLNPKTGQPYKPQLVPRGDYTRTLSQFWADGPNSETPPGHWFDIVNKGVNDNPGLVRKFKGQGRVLDALEWDVKLYFSLGSALHDAAVACWGLKGWYDGVRPITALRFMAQQGQSSDPSAPFYHPMGIKLVPGFIEQVQPGDSLAGLNNENLYKIKFYAWKGTKAVKDIKKDIAGVGWILAERWVPYQKSTFVTPPFGGYVSGHSTYSRTAAEILVAFTGDEYFPGGLAEFPIPAGSPIVGVEYGPSKPIVLQWATYRDASNQTSLSRIWGGIHPPMDDVPGRALGIRVARSAFQLASNHFEGRIIVGTKEAATVQATMFPNPAVDYTNLLMPNAESPVQVDIFSTSGALIRSEKVNLDDRAVRLELSDILPGTYIVRLRDALGKQGMSKLTKMAE